MLTAIGKSLVVFVTVLSVAFMGTALALTYTSPPFAERGDELTDYAVQIIPATETTPREYKAVRLLTSGDESEVVTQSQKLPDVVQAMYDDKKSRLASELQKLEEEKTELDNRLALLDQTIDPDKAAMEAKVARLQQLVEDVRQERVDVATQIGRRQEDVEGLLRVAEARRADVFRVRATLLQAQAEAERNEQIVGQLKDLIAQIDGDLVKARNREQQLRKQLDGSMQPNVSPQIENVPNELKNEALEAIGPEL